MERLTNTAWRNFDPWECCGQDNFCTRGCHEKGGCNNGCIVPKLYGRLAAYEDTGMEPDAIKEFRELCTDEVAELARTLRKAFECGEVDHIRDLLQAERDGRLVVLPCKVVCGTTIWWADSNFHTDPIKCEVSSFGIYTGPDGGLQVWMNCYVYGATPMSQSFRMSSIGKTAFLTREEAEEALAQKGGKNEDSGGM